MATRMMKNYLFVTQHLKRSRCHEINCIVVLLLHIQTVRKQMRYIVCKRIVRVRKQLSGNFILPSKESLICLLCFIELSFLQ
jgi:hypothetical protein